MSLPTPNTSTSITPFHFTVDKKEQEKAFKFRDMHDCVLRKGNRYRSIRWIFTHVPGLGVSLTVQCSNCDKYEGITDYASW